jgi:hypothetical protein
MIPDHKLKLWPLPTANTESVVYKYIHIK